MELIKIDLYLEIQNKINELNKNIGELAENGRQYAGAYSKYRMLLAQELLRLKEDGMPVTIAYDIARGNEEVAKAKFQELAREAIYKANIENIQAVKLQIKVLQEQLNKEWGNTNNTN